MYYISHTCPSKGGSGSGSGSGSGNNSGGPPYGGGGGGGDNGSGQSSSQDESPNTYLWRIRLADGNYAQWLSPLQPWDIIVNGVEVANPDA